MENSSSSTAVEAVVIGITELREQLRDYLEAVAYGKKELTIERYGEPLVVIVSPVRWQRTQEQVTGR